VMKMLKENQLQKTQILKENVNEVTD